MREVLGSNFLRVPDGFLIVNLLGLLDVPITSGESVVPLIFGVSVMLGILLFSESTAMPEVSAMESLADVSAVLLCSVVNVLESRCILGVLRELVVLVSERTGAPKVSRLPKLPGLSGFIGVSEVSGVLEWIGVLVLCDESVPSIELGIRISGV